MIRLTQLQNLYACKRDDPPLRCLLKGNYVLIIAEILQWGVWMRVHIVRPLEGALYCVRDGRRGLAAVA